MKRLLHYKKELSIGLSGVLVVVLLFFSITTISNASALKEVKDECSKTIAVNTKQYLSSYQTTSTESGTLTKDGVFRYGKRRIFFVV